MRRYQKIEHGVKAKKYLGQHFLHQRSTAEKIVRLLSDLPESDLVVEIGPGHGALTEHLIQLVHKPILLIETDQDLIAELQHNYPQCEVIHADFLKLDLTTITGGRTMQIIGNFPYNISSQIVFRILDNVQYIPEVVGMFQKEMADRIASKPGSKSYGILSVLTQAWYRVESCIAVSPGHFTPPPKVQSSVISMHRLETIDPRAEEPMFRTIVKSSFNQRRKMLRNSLKAFYPETLLAEEAIFTRRPEQLTLQDFYYLTTLCLKHQS